MLHKSILAALGFLLAGSAFADVRDDIYRVAGQVREEAHTSDASDAALQRARADVNSALSQLRGGGGGGSDSIYCRRIGDGSYYAPARTSDGEWLQDNGTSLAECQSQLSGARSGLFCSRIGETSYYAPKLIASETWRGDNGTDFSTCDRQVRNARGAIFCQHIRDTQYYAPANISSGEWLQDNGTSLDDCVSSLGGFSPTPRRAFRVVSGEPTVPSAPATR